MTTEKQIAANRLNAQKSTGPTTPEGKAISRCNAFKHGIYSEDMFILEEHENEFKDFRQRIFDCFEPLGELEGFLTDRIFQCLWRLSRAARHEQCFVTNEHVKVFMEISGAAEKPRRPLPFELHDPIRRQFECGLYDRLLRYETRTERSLYRALDRLQTLQKKRKRKSKPIDISDALEFATYAPNPPDYQKLKSEGTNPTGSATGSAGILPASDSAPATPPLPELQKLKSDETNPIT